MSFDYTLEQKSTWLPKGRPQPPFGPTAIEVMRSCLLRSFFDYSPGYERRMGVAARIGTAMHKALQSFTDQPFRSAEIEKIAGEAQRRFYIELESQKTQAAERPRESTLLWDPVRINRALEAVIVEAIRTQDHNKTRESKDYNIKEPINQGFSSGEAFVSRSTTLHMPASEVPVQSKDGYIRGRIDRAEVIPEGIRLIDYKSANRDDIPERYIRQLQLYAFLWYETFGEWPIDAQIYYPLKGTFYDIPVNESICRQVAAEADALIKRVASITRPKKAAIPGDTCKVCDYRPWCRPFWTWQSAEVNLVKAKEKASIGFEGQIENIRLVEHYWRLIINWKRLKIRLIVPQERFPHLVNANAGQLLRILDAPLKGALNQPTIQVFDTTEIFLVV
jgi:CRISPR/Cas system-associated exonuclease Cas4 (RecB family)